MLTKSVHCLLVGFLFIVVPCAVFGERATPERLALKHAFTRSAMQDDSDRRCNASSHYLVYLVDNFDQNVQTVSELRATHGELVQKVLTSGRDDIVVRRLNTSLARGLAQIVLDLSGGGCADAVISAIPGSNYSYQQVSTLLDEEVGLGPHNILTYRQSLLERMLSIAHDGFPSLSWLLKLDANPVKVRNDAAKLVLLQELAGYSVPVYLPYGNRDGLHRGQKRQVNLLSLLPWVHIYSGMDTGTSMKGDYPDSPLSSGVERARYSLVECPDPEDGLMAFLDIDNDGYSDYTYRRMDMVAFMDHSGRRAYAPPPLSSAQYRKMLQEVSAKGRFEKGVDVVFSPEQFEGLASRCEACELPDLQTVPREGALLRLTRRESTEVTTIEPICRVRGSLSGSSFVAPRKLKEALTRKTG